MEDQWGHIREKLQASGLNEEEKGKVWLQLIKMPVAEAALVFLAPSVEAVLQALLSASATTMEVVKEAVRQLTEDQAEKSKETIRLVGSKASSDKVKEATKRLGLQVDAAHALTPAYKKSLGPVADANPFEWVLREDDPEQIEACRAHLQQHYAPSGVRVLAVTGVRWLEASFEDEQVVIEGTHTDFIFLAEEAVELYEMTKGMTGPDRMRAIRPGILGLSETKTSKRLYSNLSNAQAQAMIELVAVDRMTEHSSMILRPILILGDLNSHYILQKTGANVTITITQPSELAYAQLHIKSLLQRRAEEGHLRLPSRFAPPGEGPDKGEDWSGAYQQPRHGAHQQPPHAASGPPDAPAGSLNPSTFPVAASDSLGGDDDENEAAREAAFSRDVVDLVRSRPVYESLGLPCAPSTIRHQNLDEWLAMKRFVE